MATTKAAGSTKLGRDSQAKRLGIKKFGSEHVIAGNIIVRQRGTKYLPGTGTKLGKDYTIFATTEGVVTFQKKMLAGFNGKLRSRTIVHVKTAA